MLMLRVVFAMLLTQSHSTPVIDVVELNTYGPCEHKQIILRQWSDSRHGVGHWITDWRTVSAVDCKAHGDKCVVTFIDTNGGTTVVICRSYRETKTAYDVEVLERKLLAPENRTPRLTP